MFVSFHAKFLVHAFNAVLLGSLHYKNICEPSETNVIKYLTPLMN